VADLYDYEAGYVGRKSYVSVRGHNRSVPRYKTYRGIDGYNYILPQFGGDNSGRGSSSAYLMPDKLEYVSPMDGTHITSRSQHRDHMRKHDVIESGDVPMGYFNDNRIETYGGPRDIVDAIKKLGGH
jgi:hypothetical protein